MQCEHERIERAALTSLHDNCPEPTRTDLGLFLDEIDGVLVSGAANEPSKLLNRAIGLGAHRPAAPETVAAIRSVYRSLGISGYLVHFDPDPLLDRTSMLDAASLVRVRGWMKFRRDNSPCSERETDLRVERIAQTAATDFARIAAAAFGLSPQAEPLLAGLACDPRWHLLVSYDGDRPAGTGGLFIDGESGWLDWAATDPAFRRRGSQGALISSRIRRAIDSGCTALFTETGEAVPGDPQHSYRNLRRFGFEEIGLRENWAPT